MARLQVAGLSIGVTRRSPDQVTRLAFVSCAPGAEQPCKTDRNRILAICSMRQRKSPGLESRGRTLKGSLASIAAIHQPPLHAPGRRHCAAHIAAAIAG